MELDEAAYLADMARGISAWERARRRGATDDQIRHARSKPAPDPYLEALARFGASPEQALVVEDSERGLRSASAAGIDCVVVRNAFVAGQDFSLATHTIDTLGELPALLERLALPDGGP